MAVTIKYNDKNPFGTRPPLVSRTESYTFSPGGHTYTTDLFTLEGKISRDSCQDGFDAIYNLIKNLVLSFAENFKKFEIIEGSTTVFSYNNAIVDSIVFDEDKYINLIPYTIRIRCLRDKFADIYGVIDPVDTYEFAEQEGCLVQIAHTVSCRGIVTSQDALTNAKNFILSKSAYNPEFVPSYGVTSPILVDEQESRNHNTAEVSITKIYKYDKSNLSGNLNFIQTRVLEQKNEDGVFVLNISGDITAAYNSSMTSLRAFMSSVKTNCGITANAEYALYNPSGVLSGPISATITESIDEKKITYSFTYSDLASSDPYILDSTVISRDSGKDCISSTISIKSNIGCPGTRYAATKSYLDSFDINSYVNVRWALYGYSTKLSSIPQQKTVSVNSQTGDIEVSITYCSDTSEDCSCLENLNYSLRFVDPIPQFSEEPAYRAEGCYAIQNLKYNNRATLEISGSCRPAKCCTIEAAISQIKSRANQLMVQYFAATDIVLEKVSVEYIENFGVITFSFGWNGIKSVTISSDIIYGNSTSAATNRLLLQNGGAILLQDGSYLLLQ